MHLPESSNNEAAILARVIQAEQEDLTPPAAKALLKLAFTPPDRDRMHQLAVKNQEDALTETEHRELDSYRRIGRLLDLLGARARRALVKHGRTA
jgi:hypothetical protein